MPHLTLEYSANLHPQGELKPLCDKLARCLLAQKADGKAVYPIGGIRVRVLRADDYCVGDGGLEAAFVHGTLKIGAGRSEQTKTSTGEALFAVMKEHFAQIYEQTGLALSLEIVEFSETGTWKHNNLHARFRAQNDAASGSSH
ncbi:5-carboxymethyl-2-hydroxymuconate Delta-isomerase [Pusillimonas noertemannii]|uniref:5-carboxymethyl-2-hydroxymuconate isomerase n=1 Tax=Pusillimonas noertemannii TaxID=305977 RepID=A0A2U1CL51_9BURK|nr:5-carboxymethyl-2-hydroxymuconate Delta-isomerase [Pusillimonas noertemannii]NYT69254.1 5-carboxymethyl-2-hydroxymuconate Delta-isomerase [Pusillimonas noertemannii]PVY61721.1 5-carboxymethyl-2-hydroxymuconate isomerase [Pusillimonas noertemannii]TFL09660.1 5-carboxymethyl-2-hydroxymuconate Delta-isomerase [Pusillimonas noertemannii]